MHPTGVGEGAFQSKQADVDDDLLEDIQALV